MANMESQQPPLGREGPDEPKVQELRTIFDVSLVADESAGHVQYAPDLQMEYSPATSIPAPQSSLPDQLAHLDLSVQAVTNVSRVATSSTRSSRQPSLVLEDTPNHSETASSIPALLLEDDYEMEDPMDISDSENLPYQHALNELEANVSTVSETDTTLPPLSQTSSSSAEEHPSRPDSNMNHDMSYFFKFWRFHFESGKVPDSMSPEANNVQSWTRPSIVFHDRSEKDIQGIDWARLGTTRHAARQFRTWYHQHPKVSPRLTSESATKIPATEELFKFRQMNMEHRAWIEHFQLRNLMVTTSHNDLYYASPSKVMHTSPSSLQPSCVMDLTDSITSSIRSGGFCVTSLASAENLLIAGGYRGEYALQHLNSEHGTLPTKGQISHNASAITNHAHTFTNRTNTQSQAVFSSNDKHVRVLDCTTNTFVSSVDYGQFVNCAATSPNGRLRLLVGDFAGAMIVDADGGSVLEQLGGHVDDAFACAWADDDIHVSTAAQDGHILIWDARNWSQPLADIACEMTYATSLRFSPVGGGKQVLVAAEAADVVSVIDANTWDRKQILDFFGDIAGTSFSADGSELLVANGDRKFGGLISYERTGGFSEDDDHGKKAHGISSLEKTRRADVYQWLPEYELDFHPRVRLSAKARSRGGLGLGAFF